MEAERSIVLQKKTILFLSLIIGILFSITYGREVNIIETTSTNLYVEAPEIKKEENEISKKEVKYLASKIIAEENFDISQVSAQKIETFAGDVISLEKENENVAEIEKTNEITEIENVEKLEIKEQETEEVTEVIESEIVEEVVEQTEVITKEESTEKQQTVKYKDLAENNPPTEYLKVVEANATAYCLCKKCCGKTPDHPYYGYTNSGIKIEVGTGMKVIAVDPKVIPLKSKVYVEGLNGAWDYGYAIAADTGSAIKNLKIDLYMDTHEEALQWGRKKVKVYVLGE